MTTMTRELKEETIERCCSLPDPRGIETFAGCGDFYFHFFRCDTLQFAQQSIAETYQTVRE